MKINKHKSNSIRAWSHLIKKAKILLTIMLVSTSWFGITNMSVAGNNILKIRSYADMKSLDPAYSAGVFDESIQSAIYSKLIQFKPGSQWGWVLDAAESIKQIDDTHIKFKLRNNIYFTGGYGQMTAEDVKFSFERIIDEKVKSRNKPDMASLKEVQVTSKLEGVIVLKEPFIPLWNITLPYITGNIISKKATEAANGKITPQNVVSSGPYMFKSWKPKQKTILIRNPLWKGEKPTFDQIHIFPIDDEKSAEIAFESGAIDFTKVSLASLSRLRTDRPKNSGLKVFPSLFYSWVGMNLDNEKLKNKNLRKAIQYAIDVPSIMAASYFGEAKPSSGIIAPGLIGHRAKSLIPSEQNLEMAKKFLKKSGKRGITLTLATINKAANVTTAQVIQANLAQIGINVDIQLHEAATFWSLGDKSAGDQWKNIELIINRYSMTPDPYYASSWFICSQIGIWNWERICEPELDKLHNAAKSEKDTKKRDTMYQRIQDIMEESGAYKFLTHEANAYIWRNHIKPAQRPDGLYLLRYFSQK